MQFDNIISKLHIKYTELTLFISYIFLCFIILKHLIFILSEEKKIKVIETQKINSY